MHGGGNRIAATIGVLVLGPTVLLMVSVCARMWCWRSVHFDICISFVARRAFQLFRFSLQRSRRRSQLGSHCSALPRLTHVRYET